MVEMMDDEIVVEVVDDLIEIEILAGEKGETGAKGDPGETGPEGPQGERGPQGIPGADGVGIALIAKVGSSGLVDTYLITLTNGVGYTFEVTNGASIASIIKTGSSGLTDTYTITLTNGDTSTFVVTNGAKGEKGDTGPQGPQGPRGAGITRIEKIGSEGLVDTYRIMYSDGYSLTYTVTNGAKGDTGAQGPQGETGPQGPQGPRGVGITDIEKIGSEGLVDIYRIYYSDGYTLTYTVTNGEKGEKGDTGPQGPQGPEGPAGPRTYTVWGEIDGYIANQTDLQNALNGKADTNHAHGDLYYSKTETDTKLAGKSDTGHDHDERYYTESEVDNLLEGKAASAHKHGNMYNDTSFPSDTAVANGDKLIIADSSANGKMARSGITFDGATTSKALTPKGTWGAFAAANHNHDSAYAAKDHNHDERYYTESEMDTALSEKAALDHGHGNLGNGGAVAGNVGIGNGDCLVVSDHSNSDKLTCTNVKFDGLDTDKALTPKGTWEPFAKPNHNHDGVYAAADHNHDDRYYTEDEINTKLNAKQDALTFDTAPTAGSGNPVTSGGVKTALDEKEDALTFDNVPTAGSGNPVTSGGVKTALDTKENTIVKTATGAIASFDDGVEAPAAHVVAKIEPVQDLHGYDHPWPAGGGKNLWNGSNGYWAAADGVWSTAGNAPSYQSSQKFKVSEGDVFYVSPTDNPETSYVMTWLNGTYVGFVNGPVSICQPYTVPAGVDEIAFDLNFGSQAGALAAKVMMNRGSTPESYEPYANICPISGRTGVNVTRSSTLNAQDGTTYSITFPSEVGTVYGGELDVTTGKLTVDREIVDLGALNWNKENYFSSGGIADRCKYPSYNNIAADAICSIYPVVARDSLVNKTISIQTGGYIVCSDDLYTDAASFKTAMNGVQFVYELAAPLTYQLTPTEITILLGRNHVWADTGDIAVDYQYDINMALDEKADNTKITGNIESASQATRNYTAGSLAIVQNQLLRITQNVATGGAITIGSNAQVVDLETLIAEKAASSHSHSADDISGGYLNVHPENNPTLIPFMNNDVAFLLKRGGSAVVTYDDVIENVDISNVFDGTPSYLDIPITGITTVVFELTLYKVFNWATIIYVDFGLVHWRAKGIKIEVMNTNYPGDTWTQKASTTTNGLGHYAINTNHVPVGASDAGGGFNKVRFTFSSFVHAYTFRIAQIGIYNYGSKGLSEPFVSRGGSEIFGTINPYQNNGADLGTSAKYFRNAYIRKLNGVEIGDSPKFTDTTYTFDTTPTAGSANPVTSGGIKTALDDLKLYIDEKFAELQ